MAKGGNVALAELGDEPGPVIVSLAWSSGAHDGDADVSVILLGANGQVRGDTDFFFYNNPQAPDGSVQLLEKTPTGTGNADRISVDLGAVPEDVVRIVVAGSRYGEGGFGELDEVRLTLADRAGEDLLGFTVADATTETALLFGELYRRDDAWRFRAIGQGYDSGLAGLATDFGIDVDDGTGTEVAVVGTGPEASAPAASPGIPAPAATADPSSQPAPATAERPRTAKKKVTLPRSAPKPSLAEHQNWHTARLFPAASLRSDRERETRATSVLLAVMAQVPEFGRRLTAPTENGFVRSVDDAVDRFHDSVLAALVAAR